MAGDGEEAESSTPMRPRSNSSARHLFWAALMVIGVAGLAWWVVRSASVPAPRSEPHAPRGHATERPSPLPLRRVEDANATAPARPIHRATDANNEVSAPAGDDAESAGARNASSPSVAVAGARITGRVVDGEGSPVEGASVTAVADASRGAPPASSDAGWLFAHTDADGRFAFDTLTAPAYSLHAYAKGRAFRRRSGVATGTRDVTLSLPPAGTYRVTVVDEATGRPLPEASLRVDVDDAARTLPFSRGEPPLPADDAPGTFLVTGPMLDGLRITADAPGHSSASPRLPALVPGEELAVTVSLRAEVLVRGTVKAACGGPLRGATVVARQGEQRLAMDRSGPDGSYMLHGLALGEALVWVTADGFDGSDAVTLRVEPNARWNATLAEPVTLSGEVRTSRGEPAPGVTVGAVLVTPWTMLCPATAPLVSDDTESPRVVSAEPDGSFAFEPLVPGEYVVLVDRGPADALRARLRALAEATAPPPPEVDRVVVHPGTSASVDLSVVDTAGVFGVVTLESVTAPDLPVAVVFRGTGVWHLRDTATTGPGGVYRFEDLPAGEIAVGATAPGAPLPRVETVRLVEGAERRLDLDIGGGGAFAGTVVSRLTGRPATDVDVGFANTDPSMPIRHVIAKAIPATVPVNEKGRFEARHLPPGRYSARAHDETGRWIRSTVIYADIEDGRTTYAPTAIEVTPEAVVEGDVRERHGRPVPDYPQVYIELITPARGGAAGAAWASDGRYRFGGLFPDHYVLRTRRGVARGTEYVLEENILWSTEVDLAMGEHRTIDVEVDIDDF